jgi:hypothetical protein
MYFTITLFGVSVSFNTCPCQRDADKLESYHNRELIREENRALATVRISNCTTHLLRAERHSYSCSCRAHMFE